MIKRAIVLLTLVVAVVVPASSYLFNFTDRNRDHWTAMPVSWTLNPARSSHLHGARSVADVMTASFATWVAAPNSAISVVRTADTSSKETGNDGRNLICFVCSSDFSDEEETLAIAFTTTISGGPDAGQILDADILFNPNRDFSTEGAPGNEDLQTVATHEIGHLFGLGHSGVVRAAMFPFAPTNERTLSYDDVAAISALYPGPRVVPTNAISGSVTLNNTGVFGAHVFAESQTTAEPFAAFNIRKSPISAFTLPDGSYTIQGVPADTYIITAEPLDLPADNSNIEDYARSFDKDSVQTNFTTRWF
jgi:hypothetical protein